MTLYEMTQQAQALYDMLTCGEIDEQTFNDTLEAIGTDEKVNSYCEIIAQLKADAQNCKAEIDRLTSRKKAFENSVERMKTALDSFMQIQAKDKIKTDKFTVSYHSSQSVNVLDVNILPSEYLTPQEPKIDKIAIKEAINCGQSVPGAELCINRSISIR